MRIVLHREIPNDPLLQKQWNDLVEEMECPEVFYTHQWALAMSRAYSGLLLPMLVLAYEGEKLIGVAALATDPAQKTASFLSSTSADYCDLLGRAEHRAELLDAVFAELGRAHVPGIALTSVPADSATMKALRPVAVKHGYRLFVRPTAVCAQVDLGSEGERVELKTALGKKKIFRHSMNSLAREGNVSFSHLVTWDAIEPLLAHFSTAHVARFLAMGRISNLVTARRRALLADLARSLSGPGWLVLSRLQVADRTIAWNYGFQFKGIWFWYQPTFDTAYERLSPGHCLLSKIISEACDNSGMRVVDLGLGAEGYKERFANGARSTMHASFTKSLGGHAREMVRYYAAQALKSAPGVDSAVRAGLGYFGRGRQEIQEGGVPGFAAGSAKRVASLLNSSEEVVFYQWMDDLSPQNRGGSQEGLTLRPADLETLAIAAMSYENDQETLSYLLRSAQRLHPKKGQGFALVDGSGTPVNFCWVGEFEGFEMKTVRARLSAPSQHAAIIFDCWTPRSKRGHGYCGITLAKAARQLANAGKEAWTFNAVANHLSGRGIERAGFQRRYSMICKKTLAWQRVRLVASDRTGSTMEAQAGS
jgi:CelD/BcsL family acetyltransferase involved in cellulose biosynthesis